MAGIFWEDPGALGVWQNKKLTIPPFVANRIVDQSHHKRAEACGDYQLAGPGTNIHHQGWAAENLHRYMDQIALLTLRCSGIAAIPQKPDVAA